MMYDRNRASGILWAMPAMPFSLAMFMQNEANVLGEIKRKNSKNKGHSLITGCEMRLGRDLNICNMTIMIKAWCCQLLSHASRPSHCPAL